MDYNEKVTKASIMHSVARVWRGDVLNHSAVIEKEIAMIISKYFCKPEREALFTSEIALQGFFSFRNKARILRIIAEDYDFVFKDSPKFFDEMEKIMTYRNKLAHATLDFTEESLMRDPKDGITLVFYKKGRKRTEVFNYDLREDWNVRMNMVSSKIKDLMNVIGIRKEYG